MSSDVRLMWPSTYDPITETHTMCVGKGTSKRLYRFTSEQWNDHKFMSTYRFGWSDPRASAYTYLSSTSTDEERKAMDAKIRKEYDALFDSAAYAGLYRKELPMNPFLDKVVKMEYVGSRITCSPPPTDTDEDVLLLTDDLETLVGDCIEVGFTQDGAVGRAYPKEFVSLRNGTMNFIITDNEEFFKKFMLATHVCKSLNVMEKSHRITVFQAILYGKEYVEETLPF